MQTKVLALKGKDGRNYTFRSLDKKASELLEEDLRGTIVDRILEDALAAQHPASEVIARGLLEAAGIPTPPWRLVVLPDDPALGEFRKEFAGQVGDFADYPSAVTESNPGFLGITEIIDHIEMYRRLQAGEGDQVDVQALLKARLVDIFMGDWDRHRKQWRWARFPSSPLWEPIPEDRDQAFSRYEGLLRRPQPQPRPAAPEAGPPLFGHRRPHRERPRSGSPPPLRSHPRRLPQGGDRSSRAADQRRDRPGGRRGCRRSGRRSTALAWPRT